MDDSGLNWRFGIPMLEWHWGEAHRWNGHLAQAVLQRATSEEGVTISNVHGWHSKKDFQFWDLPAVTHLTREVIDRTCSFVSLLFGADQRGLLEGWKIEAWANVNRPGAFNRSHDHGGHPHNVWSGIYYVRTGVESGDDPAGVGGKTYFENRNLVPRPADEQGKAAPDEHVITPAEGLAVLFPSTLRHYVEPYRGRSDRITIAFNLQHAGFAVPTYPDMQDPGWFWRNFRGPMAAYAAVVRAIGRAIRGERG